MYESSKSVNNADDKSIVNIHQSLHQAVSNKNSGTSNSSNITCCTVGNENPIKVHDTKEKRFAQREIYKL